MTDNTITIPADVQQALERYAAEERELMKKKGAGPIILKMITWKSVAQRILKNEVVKRGHWVPVLGGRK